VLLAGTECGKKTQKSASRRVRINQAPLGKAERALGPSDKVVPVKKRFWWIYESRKRIS